MHGFMNDDRAPLRYCARAIADDRDDALIIMLRILRLPIREISCRSLTDLIFTRAAVLSEISIQLIASAEEESNISTVNSIR